MHIKCVTHLTALFTAYIIIVTANIVLPDTNSVKPKTAFSVLKCLLLISMFEVQAYHWKLNMVVNCYHFCRIVKGLHFYYLIKLTDDNGAIMSNESK